MATSPGLTTGAPPRDTVTIAHPVTLDTGTCRRLPLRSGAVMLAYVTSCVYPRYMREA